MGDSRASKNLLRYGNPAGKTDKMMDKNGQIVPAHKKKMMMSEKEMKKMMTKEMKKMKSAMMK